MSINTPITPQNVALGVIGALYDNTIMGGLVNTALSDQIVPNSGGKVRVRKPARLTAEDFLADGKRQIKRQALNESYVDVALDELPDVSVTFDDEELFDNWYDLGERVLEPMGQALAEYIDLGLYKLRADVLNAGRTVTFDPKDPRRSTELVGEKLTRVMGAKEFVLSPRQTVDFNSFPGFYNAEKVADGGDALRRSALRTISGFNLYRGDFLAGSQAVPAHTTGAGVDVPAKTLAANTGVAFHKDAFCLVSKRLPAPVKDSGPTLADYMRELSNFTARVRDDSTLGGLGVRLTGSHNQDKKTYTLSADVYVGFETLDVEKAVLLIGGSADTAPAAA